MILIRLFLTFLRIGLFAFGGAYSFIPLLEREIVEKYQWLTREEFLHILGMVRIFPGAISIKFATYTGYKIAGIPGALMANLGNLLIPILGVILIAIFYTKYKDSQKVRAAFKTIELAVFAMIIAVAFKLVNVEQLIQPRNLILVISCFMLFIYTKLHPAIIIISAGILGVILK